MDGKINLTGFSSVPAFGSQIGNSDKFGKSLTVKLPNEAQLETRVVSNDAVKITLSNDKPAEAVNYSKGKIVDRDREALRAAPAVQAVLANPKAAPVQKPERKTEKPQAFNPETLPEEVITGTYGDGEFVTSTGEKGRYKRLEGGQIAFEVGNFKGIVTSDRKAYATNSRTGESVSFDVELDNGKFKLSNFKALSGPEAGANNKVLEGTVEDGAAVFDNATLRLDRQGNVRATLIDASGREVQGIGFRDKDGNVVIALEDGRTYQAQFSRQGDSIKISNVKKIDEIARTPVPTPVDQAISIAAKEGVQTSEPEEVIEV